MHALRRVAAALLVTSVVVPTGSAALPGPGAQKCFGKAATIVGTNGPDRLVGTAKADVIVGLAGDDVIDGAGGNDLICAGPGADRLVGGPGDDRLDGGLDKQAAGPGGTYLLGDVLIGGPGDDVLDGGVDSRPVDRRRRPDTYSWFDATGPVVVDLSGSAAPGLGTATGMGQDTIVLGLAHGIVGTSYGDRITGSPRSDRIFGSDGGDVIDAGDGNDLVYADGSADHTGRDVVEAGRGDDLVSSLAGRDRIVGGRGHDFVEAFSAEPTVVELGPGDDYVGQHVTPGTGAGADGGPGDDVIAFYGARLAGQKPWAQFVIDYRTGTTRATGDVEATGTIARFERHRLVGSLRWGYFGSDAADRVWAIQGGPLRARGYGGGDNLVGSNRSDLLDGGPGTDYADGRGGNDDCRSIERGGC